MDSCITRLRMTVKDAGIIDESKVKGLGASGLIKRGNIVQVVVGTRAELLADEMNALMKES